MPQGFFILVLFCSLSLNAQRIVDFKLYPTKNSVSIKFTLSAGPDCGGYQVLRSTDSVNYYPVCEFAGICGLSSTNTDYACTDNSPVLNQTSFYKILLNNFERSEVKRTYVSEPVASDIFLFPNPVHEAVNVVRIKVQGVENKRLIGFLYNQSGKPIKELDLTTSPDQAELNVTTLSNGVYFIWLTEGFTSFSSSFIILR